MNILQLSTYDLAGGAERVAWNLFRAYRERGHGSWLVVGGKRIDDPDVLELPKSEPSTAWSHACWALHGRLSRLQGRVPGVKGTRDWLHALAQGRRGLADRLGREDFDYPASRRLLEWVPQRPDIVHAHNLHGHYFDLRYLPTLSQQLPTVLTLHDEWMLTGHCAYTLGCERWQHGCGECPNPDTYPAIGRDATAWNWRRKADIYRRSKLYVATPSRWLLERVECSMLQTVEARMIHYGVDLDVYHPAERATVRHELGLPQDATILLFAAALGKRSRLKDYETIAGTIERLVVPDRESVLFLALGGQAASRERVGQVMVETIPFQSDPVQVARYYQAADVFLHAAHSDNFPNTVLESLACGTPVIATAVGGIPEQIEEGETGFLVPARDSVAMATRIRQLIGDRALQKRMSVAAAETARRWFGLEAHVQAYLDWYQEILAEW